MQENIRENQVAVTTNKKSLFEKISFVLLLAVTFLTPIFFVPASFISTQFGTSLLFASGVIASILVYVVSGLIYGSLDLPRPSRYVLGFLSLVPIVYALAGVSNGFSRQAFFGYTFDINTVGFIILGFTYIFLVSVIFRSKQRIFYSYLSFVVSSLLLSLFLLVRIIFGTKFLAFGLFGDVTSTMVGSWNNVGIFFGIGAILSVITYQMVNISRFMKVLVSVALALSIFFLALVNFAMVWIIVGISSFLFILYCIFSSKSNNQEPLSMGQKLSKVPLYTLAVLVISLAFSFLGTSFSNYLPNKLHISNVEVRPSLVTTLDIAKKTIIDHPLFGSGPNTFATQWLMWKPDEIISTVFWNTDFTNGIGLIPTFAVTTGILGVFSWLLFLGFYIYLGVKSIFIRTEDDFIKYLLVSSFFVSLYLWIMTFAYVPSTVIFILTLFFTGLFFASVYVSGLVNVETRNFGRSPREGFVSTLLMVAVLFSGIYLGYGLYKNSVSLLYFQKSSYALNTTKDILLAEGYMTKAITHVPSDVYFRALAEIEIAKLNAILSQDPNKVKAEDIRKQFSDTLTSAIKASQSAVDSDNTNYLNWVSLGQVYGAVSVPDLHIDGAYETAQLKFIEALRLNPKNPGILLLIARLAVIRGDLTQAKNYTLQAINVKRDYLDAYFLLSQIEVTAKNINGAIDSVTAASVIDPTNPAIFFQLGLLKYNIKDFNGAITALEKAVNMTPNYANAKYFLGLSYEAVGYHAKALREFEDLKITNPDSPEVNTILSSLREGKSLFVDPNAVKPEKAKKLPVKEKVR
ncbi:MAG: tetratricopeptide repeat protein [Nitrospira sp.]